MELLVRFQLLFLCWIDHLLSMAIGYKRSRYNQKEQSRAYAYKTLRHGNAVETARKN